MESRSGLLQSRLCFLEGKDMERNQFTCYKSYYDAISLLPDCERLVAYDLLMQYAYVGENPDIGSLPSSVASIFMLLRPNLDAGRRKAENRLGKMKNKAKTNEEQTGNKGEKKEESKDEGKSKVESKSECKSKCEDKKESLYSLNPLTPFERFWQAYPRKEGRREAERVFAEADVSVDVLLRALAEQRQQPNWQKENGRYIPGPAKWLSDRRWETVPPALQSDDFGELELKAIRRIMSNPPGF